MRTVTGFVDHLQAYYRLYNNLVSRFPPKELALLIVSPDFASATYELWTRISSLVMQEVFLNRWLAHMMIEFLEERC